MNTQLTTIKVIPANNSNIINIAKLFDKYRVFYKKKSDLDGAIEFIKGRFTKKEAFIFAAYLNDMIVGFAQVYPSFSSINMEKIYVLNDLFIDENFRRFGAGKALIQHVKIFAQNNKVNTIVLETSSNNSTAKALYESFGFSKEIDTDHYSLVCGSTYELGSKSNITFNTH
ncbi:hypothetical protein P256_02564 [Acinetobacter nectaris CIP 110549]|uniref:N-acetyltransferase domain-containing protein n=1 Tax=Acinetobacter nectaris CIP 110549 TaxID=1392540 RepID=V2TEL4_9GAMM|nr:GNAT family N-acetyltransferase [Acinetobacter nectaris]ESK36257.1 hypothetical protein P256_02564 [Acinetobacter nectaris CIP 110549]